MASITRNGITLSTDSGSGNATITVSATPNTRTRSRQADFNIVTDSGLIVTIKVIQKALSINVGENKDNIGNDTETNL